MTRQVCIIGGGYSGAAAAIHMARGASEPLTITVVEPRARPGGGTAYDTADPALRLNVEDSLMVLYPDALDHFSVWLTQNRLRECDAEGVTDEGEFFARRGDFGRYVTGEYDRWAADNPSGSRLVHRRDEAVSLRRDAGVLTVVLASGGEITADLVVLAAGNERPAPLNALPPDVLAHEGYRADPWATGALEDIASDARILLVGSGLTGVDVIASLTRRGHRGPIDAVSRRGLMPQRQGEFPGIAEILRRISLPVPLLIEQHGEPRSVAQILRWVRDDARAAAARGETWRGAFDAVRDAAKYIWPRLSLDERRRFYRHLKPFYDSHRFRVAPQIDRVVQDRFAAGALTLSAARITGGAVAEAGLQITLRDRGETDERTGLYDHVINCTGPNPDPAASGIRLLREAVGEGLLCRQATGVGLAVNDQCETLDAAGQPNRDVLAVGPISRGHFGEVVAVPQITMQLVPLVQRLKDEGRI